MVIVIIQKNKRLRECPNTFLLQALSSADLCFSVEVFISVVLLSKDASNATADFTFRRIELNLYSCNLVNGKVLCDSQTICAHEKSDENFRA